MKIMLNLNFLLISVNKYTLIIIILFGFGCKQKQHDLGRLLTNLINKVEDNEKLDRNNGVLFLSNKFYYLDSQIEGRIELLQDSISLEHSTAKLIDITYLKPDVNTSYYSILLDVKQDTTYLHLNFNEIQPADNIFIAGNNPSYTKVHKFIAKNGDFKLVSTELAFQID